MSRSLPLAVVLAVLAIAAPAQAAVTSSTITSPADPHFVLVDFDQPRPTIAIAGTATGSGDVDIVCQLGDETHVLAFGVPVAASGTFELADVPLNAVPGAQIPNLPAVPCRLRAVPAGTTPADTAPFSGPRLGVTKVARARLNNGNVFDTNVQVSGLDFTARTVTFGQSGFYGTYLQVPGSSAVSNHGFWQAGAPEDKPDTGHFGVEVDGEAAYPPTRAAQGIAGGDFSQNPGLPEVDARVEGFSPETGDLRFHEVDPLVKCGPLPVYPPTAAGCTEFDRVPVVLERTTEFSDDTQIVRVVDRWSSLDGQPHRLDLSLSQGRCFGDPSCSIEVVHKLPGQSAYANPLPGTVTGPVVAEQPIFSRHSTDASLGGVAVIPGQSADSARFDDSYYFALRYTSRTIPATGELTFVHTYVTTRSADEIEAAVAALTPAPSTPSTPHGGGTTSGGTTPTGPKPGSKPAAPRFSRHGRVRVRRAGRTFVVRTRERVHCPAGGPECVVTVRGARVRTVKRTVPAGATARVSLRLTRGGVRALTRRGKLRLVVTVAARAGSGTKVARVRRLTVRTP
jgi:hypothetical protein